MTLLDPLFGWEVTDRIFSDTMRLTCALMYLREHFADGGFGDDGHSTSR